MDLEQQHQLTRQGWYIDTKAMAELAKNSSGSLNTKMDLLLDSDLRKIGSGCLPEEVSKSKHCTLRGPFILQLVSTRNIAQPRFSQHKAELLLIEVTDGKRKLKCLDHKGSRVVTLDTPPGTKICLNGGTVRQGILLIEPENFMMLGGRVSSLVEEWHFEKKSGTTRMKAQDEEAPAFAHFDPTKAPKKIDLGDFNTFETLSQSSTFKDEGESSNVTRQSSVLPTAQLFHNQAAVRSRLLGEMPDPSFPKSAKRREARATSSTQQTFTLEEFEAQQHRSLSKDSQKRLQDDEQLARELQESLNLQDSEREALDLASSMFSYSSAQNPQSSGEQGRGRRGRGRGRGRGRSRRGRNRGR